MGYFKAAVKGIKGVVKVGKAIKGAKNAKNAKKKTPQGNVEIGAPTIRKGRAAADSAMRAPQAPLTKVEIHTAVMGALREARADKLARANGVNSVSKQVDARMKPQVTKMLSAIQRQAIQRQATAEHNALNAEKSFRSGTSTNLKAISQRLDEVSAGMRQITAALQLPGIAIVRRKLPIYGPKSVLQG